MTIARGILFMLDPDQGIDGRANRSKMHLLAQQEQQGDSEKMFRFQFDVYEVDRSIKYVNLKN